jgi:hypothetical protein
MPTLYGRDLTRQELMRQFGDASQVFGVRLATLGDGVERGVRVLQFRAGNGLTFDILIDRGFDLGSLEYRGAALGFHSPTGFRSPWLHNADGEAGLGFLRSFSGLLNTCGLDHVMGPETEPADHYNYPFRKTIIHGMHGRIAFTPGRLGGYGTRWDGAAASSGPRARSSRPPCLPRTCICSAESRSRSVPTRSTCMIKSKTAVSTQRRT